MISNESRFELLKLVAIIMWFTIVEYEEKNISFRHRHNYPNGRIEKLQN